jgi:SAM-dependent methyltransferase
MGGHPRVHVMNGKTNPADDRVRWTERYDSNVGAHDIPSAWVVRACARIAPGVTVIDIAAGSGRHSEPLAQLGHHVIAIDFVELAVRRAVARHPRIHGLVASVWELPLGRGSADAVLCTNFLERAFFPELVALLKPGGVLIYETYTTDHRKLVEAGRARAPRSADYLLAPGELPRLVAPLEIIDAREGYVNDEAGERHCASIFAQKAK